MAALSVCNARLAQFPATQGCEEIHIENIYDVWPGPESICVGPGQLAEGARAPFHLLTPRGELLVLLAHAPTAKRLAWLSKARSLRISSTRNNEYQLRACRRRAKLTAPH